MKSRSLSCIFLPLLWILALPVVEAQEFRFTISDGTATVRSYIGAGGAVTIPATIYGLPVTAIGENAFRYPRTSPTSVTMPDSVTSIGERAFSGCHSLTNVTIGYGVTSIGDGAFDYCISLTAITVNAANSAYSSADGILFNKSESMLIRYPIGKAGPAYTIPDSVTSIREWAFFGCSSLTSVTIPDSVTSIGEWAFFECTFLVSVTIGNGVTSIPERAYASCRSLASISIGNGVTSIEDWAFDKCTSLTSLTIPNGVTSIGEAVFSDCTNLASITIPDSVTSIGDSAFRHCDNLTSITIPNSVTNIGQWALHNCNRLAEITVSTSNPTYSSVSGVLFNKSHAILILYPTGKAGTSYTIPDSVTKIGKAAFSNCTSLASITIPDSVTSIEDFAFSDCTNLTSITIPDSVINFGRWTFDRCVSLTSVTIPTRATSIGDRAFYRCTSLTSVTIPDSVTSIGDSAFSNCDNLTSITIPDSVIDIGQRTFSNCDRLAVLFFEGNAPNLDHDVFQDSNQLGIFYLAGTTGWGESYGGRPTRLTTGELDPLIGGLNLGGFESWFVSGWLGSYSTAFAPWLFHLDHGFIYPYPQSSDGSIYFYDNAMTAWWWTTSGIFPWIYVFDPPADNGGTDIDSQWLLYDKYTNDPRTFSVQTGEMAGATLYYGP